MNSKVLIVDDSASDRMIIRRILEEYDILEATDGIEALDVLENDFEINIIILDLNMPRMNGFEVLEHLKKQAERDLSVIILTNYEEIENEIKVAGIHDSIYNHSFKEISINLQ